VTKAEEDFVRWMDALDLEEVNLLDEPVGHAESAQDRERRSGEREKPELPPSRGIGWD